MKAARELLDQRGRIYISRPEFAITQDVLSGGNRIVLMRYGPRWRSLRTIMHQLLMASNVSRILSQHANSIDARYSRTRTNLSKRLNQKLCFGNCFTAHRSFIFMVPDLLTQVRMPSYLSLLRPN